MFRWVHYTAVVELVIPSTVNPGEEVTTSSDPISIEVGSGFLITIVPAFAVIAAIFVAFVLLRKSKAEKITT